MEELKILALDNLQKVGIDYLKEEGFQVDVSGKLKPEELIKVIDDYDAIIVRSGTKVPATVLDGVKRLKVIGRAGIGVDNIDISGATKSGVVVMNTPGGNTITTAEHAISLMMSLMRNIPQANHSMKSGKWEKSKFMGTEICDKTLGIIGLGNIGKIVADRAKGLKMIVIGFDPYLSSEDAARLGVELVSLDSLYQRADVITVHTPLTPETKDLINSETISKMKDGVCIINCARGGIVNEEDAVEAVDSGKVGGVAIDVYPKEPPSADSPIFSSDRIICTPHLGASTIEAQEKVAVQIADQISDYLKRGTIRNSVNFPSISAELVPILRPYLELGEKMGSFHGQLLDARPSAVTVEYYGDVTQFNTSPITLAVLKGILQHLSEGVNLVNSRMVAEERGIKISEGTSQRSEDYASLIRVKVASNGKEFLCSGTTFGNEPMVVKIMGFHIEAHLSGSVIMMNNEDVPGVVGRVGTYLGENQINIAGLQLGREKIGGTAISLINVDQEVPPEVIEGMKQLPAIMDARYIVF
jgi:D-3-phosphoglycerate dehydrogenase